jgi:hypothetical protein
VWRLKAEQAHEGRAKAQRLDWHTSKGERSREHRLGRLFNCERSSTDFRSEQRSEAESGEGRARGNSSKACDVQTAREQRASRGVTAGREGNALKAEILWVDVARNKATRPGRAQAAEGVRNSESGWCRLGKPAQRSPGFKRRKDPNSMGDVVEFPLRVLRLRSTSVARRWEASTE